LGLALEESTDGLEKLESNGIQAYIDPGLQTYLQNHGDIHLDYIDQGPGRTGFAIRVGTANCGDGSSGCDSCSH